MITKRLKVEGRRSSAREKRHRTRITLHVSRFTQHAFSLIEILVTVALLSLIILGLLSMFTQTQRAFRNSMKQVDVMSAGRAVTDMLARELKEITPSQVSGIQNFFAEIPPDVAANRPFAEIASLNDPFRQGLPGTTFQGQPNTQERRTNIVQRIFFLSRVNVDWFGTGYEVFGDYDNAGVGTLYRFSMQTNRMRLAGADLAAWFTNAIPNAVPPNPNLSRIADGIVHFRVRAFGTNGLPIIQNNTSGSIQVGTPGPPFTMLDQFDYHLWSNAVPAYLELELGVLEPHILERYKGIGSANAVAQREYLSNHVAQVHLFRQRIPIRNVDFNAYQ